MVEGCKNETLNIKLSLEKWHFYLLVLVLLNFGIGLITGYRLNPNLTFVLKVILYLTGIILFITTIRPFKKIAIYYLFYPISGLLPVLFYLFGGIFFSILSTIVLFPIVPKQIEHKTESIKIYYRFQGFMAPCCSYEVVEPKLYIFEKQLGYIKIDNPINAERDSFSLKNNVIYYKYEIGNGGVAKSVRDTTVILKLE